KLTVTYYPYPGISSDYTLYDDDRLSPRSLADGAYRLIKFNGECKTDGDITVTINSEGTYESAPGFVNIDFNIEGLERKPKLVSVNDKKTKFTFDATSGTLNVKIKFTPGVETKIELNY
ncbi:MAG: DUF5110 domain-containing protein, partial [Muribaculaceae bacterium]|nr:DUF5110 domain-containing protein [Muribaculaceae bacterium]